MSEIEKKKWFLKCFNEHEASLLRFAYKILKNKDQAQDIVQEAFVKLWNKFEDKDLGAESPWLFTVTRNACYDLLRKNKSSDLEISEFSEKLSDPQNSALEKLEQFSDETRLHNVLKDLPDQQREVLFLKFSEEKSYAEISLITGMRPNHVAVFVFNIMKSLRNKFKEVGYEATKR